MSYRGLLSILALLAIAATGARLLGEWFRIGLFAGLAAALLLATARLRRVRRRSTEALVQLDEAAQDTALADVDPRERVELLRRLGRQLPAIELSADEEVFEYPRPLRHTIVAVLVLDLIVLAAVMGALPVRPPAGWVEWAAVAALLAAFGGAAAVLVRYLGDLRARIVASESGLARVGPRRTVRIGWHEATRVRNRDAFEMLLVAAADGRTIRVHQRIEDFGRLLELVETRAAGGSLRVSRPDGAVAWPLRALRHDPPGRTRTDWTH